MTEDEMIGWHHQLYEHEFQELVMDREAWLLQSMELKRVGHD